MKAFHHSWGVYIFCRVSYIPLPWSSPRLTHTCNIPVCICLLIFISSSPSFCQIKNSDWLLKYLRFSDLSYPPPIQPIIKSSHFIIWPLESYSSLKFSCNCLTGYIDSQARSRLPGLLFSCFCVGTSGLWNEFRICWLISTVAYSTASRKAFLMIWIMRLLEHPRRQQYLYGTVFWV
jgi:hypothetical protein